MAPDDPKRIQKLVFRAAVVGGLGQFAVVFVFYLLVDGKIPDALFALSVGIAGSAVWWAWFARYAEDEFRRVLEHSAREQRESFKSELATQRAVLESNVRHRNDLLQKSVPSAVYEEQHGSDLRFWRDLMNDLEHSTTYQFLGVSGIWVAARIHFRPPGSRRLTASLVLVDPRSDAALEQAGSDHRKKKMHRGKSREGAEADVRADIRTSIVALFDVRQDVGRILISFDAVAVRERIDSFDRAVYDGDVADPGSANYPRTARWESHEPEYRRLADKLEGRSPSPPIEFRHDSDEADLERHLKALGLSHAGLADVRDTYKREKLDFMEQQLLPAVRDFRELL